LHLLILLSISKDLLFALTIELVTLGFKINGYGTVKRRQFT